MLTRRQLPFLLSLMFLMCLGASAAGKDGLRLVVRESLIENYSGPADIFEPKPPLYYTVPSGNGYLVVVNGKKGREFDRLVSGPHDTPDGKHVWYIGERSGKQFVSFDGVEEGEFDSFVPVGRDSIEFSADSSHHVYWGKRENQYCAVFDGIVGQRYELIQGLVISDDGLHIAYKIRRGKSEVVVVDGKEDKPYSEIGAHILLSPVGGRVMYTVKAGNTWIPVIDGKEENHYDGDKIVFSPDGKHVACVGSRDGKQAIWLDGQELACYNTYEFEKPVFSGDSKHLAYVLKKDRHKFVVIIDGKEGKTYRYVRNVASSPGNGRIIYMAKLFDKPREVLVGGKLRAEDEFAVVENGEEGPAFNEIRPIEFSPDGKRLAYLGRSTVPGTGGINSMTVVLDGKQLGPYDYVVTHSRLGFTLDHRRFIYTVRQGGNYRFVVDGAETGEYGKIETGFVRESTGRIRFGATKGGKTYRVDVEIVEDKR